MRFIPLVLLILLSVFASGWQPTPRPPSEALRETELQFRRDLTELREAVEDYREGVVADLHLDSLQRLHLRTRKKFKHCEFLLAFLQPAAVTRFVNGAPLPRLEPNVPEIVIRPPRGLQTLDELLFRGAYDGTEARQLTQQLEQDLKRISTYLSGVSLQHRHVFEGMRQGVIRVFTLGVTGFDTPGSVAAVDEAAYALDRIEGAYRRYSGAVAERDAALDRRNQDAFSEARKMLTGADFDTFDRLEFLRRSIDPLLAGLPRAQRLLGIETADDGPLPRPLNPLATSLFAADFLNADFYARLSPSDQGEARRRLGERLFFDTRLSESGRMSCATCHQPELAFTDGKRKSVRRNAPTLINSVFSADFFYDLREAHLDRQARHVIADAEEFDTDPVRLLGRLRAEESYRTLFDQAYGEQGGYALSAWSVGDALGHYVRSLRSFDSPFDRYARGETTEVDEAARRGFNLFMGKAACGSCHFPPTFSGLLPPYYRENETEVLGVPATARWSEATIDPDPGRYGSGRPRDESELYRFSFKTPTVRNVELTGPYMHNGVYDSLEQVVRFYNLGGGSGIGIELPHQTLPFDSLSLTPDESTDLVAFMQSLTDARRASNPVPDK
jgi:cytochrome c peroxidase